MATKRFIIEVEEGDTECRECPYVLMNKNGLIVNCIGTKYSHCMDYNLATMKIKKLEEESNEGQALLYAVEKAAERTKREMIEKVAEWMWNFKDGQGNFPLYDYVGNFKQAMEEEK